MRNFTERKRNQNLEEYEGEETFADELKKSKPPILKSYDLDDLKTSFQQVAGQIQTGKAQVVSMNMEFGDHMNKITFEVYVYKP